MKKIITVFVFVLVLAACSANQVETDSNAGPAGLNGGGAGITALQGVATTDRDNYDQETNFCDYIFFHKTEAKILVDYNFFPQETDVCQQVTYDAELNPSSLCRTAKTVVLPCGFESVATEMDDLLSIDVSAPIDGEACSGQIILDVSSAEFTIDGLVFSFSTSLDVFSDDLGFKITREGIINVSNGALLSFGSKDFGLEEIVSEIQ